MPTYDFSRFEPTDWYLLGVFRANTQIMIYFMCKAANTDGSQLSFAQALSELPQFGTALASYFATFAAQPPHPDDVDTTPAIFKQYINTLGIDFNQ